MGAEHAEDRSPVDVEIAKAEGKTARSIARIDKVHWFTAPLAVVIVAWVIAGRETTVDLSFISNISLTAAVPAGVLKIYLDRRQKIRLRARVAELESENRSLRDERSELRGEVRALERAVPDSETTQSESQASGG